MPNWDVIRKGFDHMWSKSFPLVKTPVTGKPWDHEGSDGHFYGNDGTIDTGWSDQDQNKEDCWREWKRYVEEHTKCTATNNSARTKQP